MNRIIIAIFALAFVQLVSSQTACQQALTALYTDATCNSTDAATLCMGTCRTLYDNVISNCDNATTAGLVTAFDTICGPCGMALSALESDAICANATDATTICMGACRTLYDNITSSCDNAIAAMFPTVTDICTPCGMAISTLSSNTCINATDANTLCMGTCRTLYDNVLSNCDNAIAAGFVTTIDTVCGPCGMALSALGSDTTCINATDANTLCMGTCRGLYDNIINNCNATISAGYNTTISTFCSGGTNTGDRCGIAGGAIDDACLTSLGLEDNTTCTGSCGSQLATAAAACTTSSDEAIQGAITAYNGLCGFEAQCIIATNEFNAVTTCYDALQSNDTGALCSASCRSLLEGVQNSCPAFTGITQEALNQGCEEAQCAVATNEFNAVSTCEDALQSNDIGALCSASCRSLLEGVQNSCPAFTGITREALNQGCEESGSEVLRASGIITLLLVAIFAFIVRILTDLS